jgi:hypothetical protein
MRRQRVALALDQGEIDTGETPLAEDSRWGSRFGTYSQSGDRSVDLQGNRTFEIELSFDNGDDAILKACRE